LEVAKAYNVTGSQIALAWILSKPYVTAPIVGATRLEHLDQSIAALEISLAPEEIKHLEELYQPHPVLGHS
jgi:aryl-alcohol dehydrogenase (NADP+)